MLFAYNDDGRLEVVADDDEARRHFESHDIETGAIRLFDAKGAPLVATYPQRTTKRFLGVVVKDDPGPLHLAPMTGENAETLSEAFGPTVVLMPNQWFPDLEAVKAHLAAHASQPSTSRDR